MVTNPAKSQAPEQTLDAFIALSQSLRWDHVPEATRANVRRELLDYLGAAIAGRAAAGMPPWLKVLVDAGGRPDARVLGGPRVPAATAALCNGFFGHVLEFDDTHDDAALHASSAAIPAAFATALPTAWLANATRDPARGIEIYRELLARYPMETEAYLRLNWLLQSQNRP